MFDEGSGPPVVVIPGVQGRWEWMMPALRALSARCRVISYSLGRREDVRRPGRRRSTSVLDERGVGRRRSAACRSAGLIAAKYAAARPERTSALIVVSTPSPAWTPSPRAGAVSGESVALDAGVSRDARRAGCGRRSPRPSTAGRRGCGSAPSTWRGSRPRRSCRRQMAARMKLSPGVELAADCARVRAPDARRSPASRSSIASCRSSSTREFVGLVRGAEYVMMDRTGHIGLVTQPDRFARIVGEFVNGSSS